MSKLILISAILLSATITSLFAQSELEKHFFKGEYSDVINLFNQQVADGEVDVYDYQLAAKSYEQQFDFASAVNCYRQALTIDSNNVQTLEGLADASIQLGMKKEAMDIYSGLLK